MSGNVLSRIPVLLIWLFASAILIFLARGAISDGTGLGPDDQLRLVQLRDWLAGQSWFDTNQYRINPPDGTSMHWPRLIELPLALIVVIASPLFGQATAEAIAMTLVPLIGLGLCMWLVAKITNVLTGSTIAYLAAAMTAVTFPVVLQLRPMRIDHHGWQIVLALFVLWTMLWPDKRRGGIFMGAALALWLQISMEGLPLSVAFIVLLSWRWLFSAAHGVRLMWTSLSFMLASLALYILIHGQLFGAQNYCDAISPAHLYAVLASGAIMIGGLTSRAQHIAIRAATLILAGGVAGLVFYLSAPQCLNGAFSEMDPLVRSYWYANVPEGIPAWRQSLTDNIFFLIGPVIGLFGAWNLLRLMRGKRREAVFIVTYALTWAFLVSLLVFRASAVASAYAIPFVAWLVLTLFGRARALQSSWQRILATFGVAMLVIPGPFLISLIEFPDTKKTLENDQQGAGEAQAVNCEAASSIARLNELTVGNILASFDLGPMILAQTPHKILASSHHRNHIAMRDQIRIFTSLPADARALAAQHDINYIVTCDGEAELELYAERHKEGLWAKLSSGTAYDWLEPVSIRDSGLSIWRIVR